MEENNPKGYSREISINPGKNILGLRIMAYKEYIAARHLLTSGFLHQAAFFINTCLEKELKLYLFSAGIEANNTHETTKLLNLVSLLEKVTWAKEINREFIKVNSKIYRTRYFENLGPGFNFVINKNKFLAELDFTYSLLESKSQIAMVNKPNNPFTRSRYQEAVKSNDPKVYLNNYILNNITKEEFLRQPDMVYEFRILDTHHPVQAEYSIPSNIELDKFNYEGLKQISQNSMNMSQFIPDNPQSQVLSFIQSQF